MPETKLDTIIRWMQENPELKVTIAMADGAVRYVSIAGQELAEGYTVLDYDVGSDCRGCGAYVLNTEVTKVLTPSAGILYFCPTCIAKLTTKEE